MSDSFDPSKVSPSRIGTYAQCGHAFKLRYIDRVQPDRNGSAALFGSVMHHAREHWVVDRELDLPTLVGDAWVECTREEPVVGAFIRAFQPLSKAADECRREILRRRPEIKQVSSTKDWRESEAKADLDGMTEKWLPRLEESKYDFTASDPLPSLYEESFRLAERYEQKYRHLPPAIAVEIAFDFEWHGFRLVGHIDDISPLVDRATGEFLGYGIVDAKTYRQEKHEFKDWRQCALYKLAYHHLVKLGVAPAADKLYVGIDRMRLLDYRWFDLDDRDERRLLHELEMYRRGVENGVYVPASKTCDSKFCDFAKTCAFYHGSANEPVLLNVA